MAIKKTQPQPSEDFEERFSESVVQDSDFIINKKKILRLIEREIPEAAKLSILEVGCNQGQSVRVLQERYPNTCGIDISGYATQHSVTRDVLQRDATDTGFPENQFDFVFASHVVEHIPNGLAFFRELSRILKPGGKVVLVYPYELFRGMAALRTSWQTFGTPFRCRELHVIRYTPKRIRKVAGETELIHQKSRIFFANTPQWLTVLTKPNPA